MRLWEACVGAVSIAVIVLIGESCLLLQDAQRVVRTVPGEIAQTRSDVLAEVASVRIDAFALVREQAMLLQGQIFGARKDAIGEVQGLHRDALRAFGAGLYEVNLARQNADDQLTTTNAILFGTARAAARSMAHANDLMDTYSALPDRVATSPSWLAIEPEITCRHEDGSGYGGCWHSRMTALMGEAANVGGVFTQQFPQFSKSVTGIAADGRRIADRFTAPCGKWCTTKEILGLGLRGAAVAGGAGIF